MSIIARCGPSRNFSPQLLSVYEGQTCLGHLLKRGPRGWEAFDVYDKSRGTFPTMTEAAAALEVMAP